MIMGNERAKGNDEIAIRCSSIVYANHRHSVELCRGPTNIDNRVAKSNIETKFRTVLKL